MNKLRRILAWLFAALSVLMAFAAILKSHRHRQESGEFGEGNARMSEWGRNLESKARKFDKLILFTTREDLDESKLSPLAKKCLFDRYILSKLEPARYPADYEILKRLFNSISGRDEEIAVGLLSPKMRPIYLSSSLHYNPHGRENCLNRLLPGAAAIYDSVSAELQNRAGQAAEILDSALPSGPAIPSGPAGAPFFADIQSWSLLALFEKTAFLPAGVLSENARLAVLINSRFPRQFCAHKAADIAVMRLAQALSSTRTYASAKERLVLLRAAAEISGIRDYAALRGKCLETGLSILKYQDKNGLFAFSGAGADIAENALAVSFLAKLSSHSPDARIEQALKHCAKALVKILNMPGEMPAAVDRGKMGRIASQASSYEYAYLCSALADMHKLTGENAYLDALSKSADEWGRFYMTKLGLFSVNSQNSALGGFLRPVLVEDYEMPSYLGEAAQSAKYLSKHRRNAAFPCGGKLAIMSDAAFRQIPLNNGSYASFKLAALR